MILRLCAYFYVCFFPALLMNGINWNDISNILAGTDLIIGKRNVIYTAKNDITQYATNIMIPPIKQWRYSLPTKTDIPPIILWQFYAIFKKIPANLPVQEMRFTKQEFITLSEKEQKIVYQTANASFNVDLVQFIKKINPSIEPESKDIDKKPYLMLSPFMDIASILENFRTYLTNIFNNNLFTLKIPDRTWQFQNPGYDIYQNYLNTIIKEHNFTYICIPKLKIVIEDKSNEAELVVFPINHGKIQTKWQETKNSKIHFYSKKISHTQKQSQDIPEEAFNQLIQFITITQYSIYAKKLVWSDKDYCFYCTNIDERASIQNTQDYLTSLVAENQRQELSDKIAQAYESKQNNEDLLPTFEEALNAYNTNQKMREFVDNCKLVASTLPRVIPFTLTELLGEDYIEKIKLEDEKRQEQEKIKQERKKQQEQKEREIRDLVPFLKKPDLYTDTDENPRIPTVSDVPLIQLPEEVQQELSLEEKARPDHNPKFFSSKISLIGDPTIIDLPEKEKTDYRQTQFSSQVEPQGISEEQNKVKNIHLFHQKLLRSAKYIGLGALFTTIFYYVYKKYKK